jgi:hemoglobin/transferrin/lactoferrin receptor protein
MNGSLGFKFNVYDLFDADLSSTVFAAQNNVAAGEMTTPGYAVFNVYLYSKLINFASTELHVSAGVENIFDKNYRNHLSTTRGSITIEPGRNFFVKLAVGI